MRAKFSGVCDWCITRSNDLVEHKDFEEGAAGAEYFVCGKCRQKERESLNRELQEIDDEPPE